MTATGAPVESVLLYMIRVAAPGSGPSTPGRLSASGSGSLRINAPLVEGSCAGGL